MKYLCLLIAACFCSFVALGQKVMPIYKIGDNKFEITNIDSIQSVYIIYARRHDSIIKIVSEKMNLIDCHTIIKGKSYDLKIQSLLEPVAGKLHIGGVNYCGVLVKTEGSGVIWDLFYCENLNGLCYVPTVVSQP